MFQTLDFYAQTALRSSSTELFDHCHISAADEYTPLASPLPNA
jgi:hypothetical protein